MAADGLDATTWGETGFIPSVKSQAIRLTHVLSALFDSCVVLWYACRLPHLSSISIELIYDGDDGDLDPVLCQLHMHATALRSLSLQLEDSWAAYQAWASLGKMTNLTELQLWFSSRREQSTVWMILDMGSVTIVTTHTLQSSLGKRVHLLPWLVCSIG
jgi:hypothetical protein